MEKTSLKALDGTKAYSDGLNSLVRTQRLNVMNETQLFYQKSGQLSKKIFDRAELSVGDI